MKDFRSIYDDLKNQAGDQLLTADAVREMKHAELAAQEETAVEPKEDGGLKFGDIDEVNPDEVMLGDVKMKDLLIAAINTLIKDNDDQLWDEDEPGIECTVDDILDYAGIDIDELLQDETMEKYVLSSGDDGHGGVITFLDKMICIALAEFGTRGWDIKLVDAVSEESLHSIDEGVEVFKDLYKICGITEDEYAQTMKGLRLLMIMNEFGKSEITINFEDPNEEEDDGYDDYDDYDEDESKEEPAEEGHTPDTAFTRSLDKLEEYLNRWFNEEDDEDDDDYDEEVC